MFRLKRVSFNALTLSALAAFLALPPSSIGAEVVNQDKLDEATKKEIAEKPITDKWALVVGISKFKDGSINLKFPAKDATDVYNYLIKEGNFARDHVKLLVNQDATRERILDELGDKWLPRVAMPDDLVLIYVSTHGSPADADVGGVNYLVAYDTDKDRLYSTGIAMQDLCRIIKARVHSDRTLILLDACHSGATTPDGKGLQRSSNIDADSVAVGTGQLVICSSEPSQTSWEAREVPNSVFTRRLLEGLALKGKNTTLGDTFNYLQKKVQEDVLRDRGQMQTPVLKSKWEGKDLVINTPPSEPRKGLQELPPAPVLADSNPPAMPSITAQSTAPTSLASMPPSAPMIANRATGQIPQTRFPARPGNGYVPGPDQFQALALQFDQASAQAAIAALKRHFILMAEHKVRDAFADFTPGRQSRTDIQRYTHTVMSQNYLPAVRTLSDSAFTVRNANPRGCAIIFDERTMTGLPLKWTYMMVNVNGTWLIDDVLPINQRQQTPNRRIRKIQNRLGQLNQMQNFGTW